MELSLAVGLWAQKCMRCVVVQTTPAALALTDVSTSVSAVAFGDLDLDANHVGGDGSCTPPVVDAGIVT